MNYEQKFTMALIIVVSLFSLGVVTDVFGWHDYGQLTWATPNNAYLCNPNLSDITHELINPCADLANAAFTWNSVSRSNWTLTFTAGSSAPIHVMSANLTNADRLAETIPVIQNNKIIGGNIIFHLDHGFTNSAVTGSNSDYYDYESIALHEFGHLQWVGHSTWNHDSVMRSNLEPGTVRNVLEQHDLDVLRARYLYEI